MFAYAPAPAGTPTGFAVVTDRFLCLLGPETTPETARGLYHLLDSTTAHLDDVLASVVDGGGAQRFAIVEIMDAAERTMHVAVCGSVTVDIEGTTATRLSGPTGATWINGEARGVSSLRMSLDDDLEPAVLPIRRGVVATLSIVVDDLVAQAPVFVDEPSPPTVQLELPRSVAASVPEKAEESAAQQPAAKAPKAKAKPRTTKPVARKKPLSRDALGQNDQTSTVDIASLRGAPPEPTWFVRLPDGNELDARAPIVIGRRPWPADIEQTSTVHVAAPSPDRQISGSHLELAVVGDVLYARDLDSTNGTIVLTPARAPRLLHEGQTVTLRDGDALDVGENYVVVVGLRA